MGELKTEVTLVADSVVDGVKRKAGDKVVVPVSLADAFGKGRAMTPELRSERVAKQEADEKKAEAERKAAVKEALKEARAENAEESEEKPKAADKQKS